jgi:hypothetical protein
MGWSHEKWFDVVLWGLTMKNAGFIYGNIWDIAVNHCCFMGVKTDLTTS